MGKYDGYKKFEADYLKKIEVWWLQKGNYFNSSNSGIIEWKNRKGEVKSSIKVMSSCSSGRAEHIHFTYTQNNMCANKQIFFYKIRLTTTPCNFGGNRYWFICPLTNNGIPCRKRVGILYKKGYYFGCRHCHNLTYNSRNENRRYKHTLLFHTISLRCKADDIRVSIKNPYYAGKPTKKLIKLNSLQKKIVDASYILNRDKLI